MLFFDNMTLTEAFQGPDMFLFFGAKAAIPDRSELFKI